jgi:isoquinoline 1-oxidoreductase alpha subunit
MPTYSIKVNGKSHTVDVSADMPLLWVLRDHLNLVGTKYGCGIALCGSCTVHVDGDPARSCVVTLEQVAGKEITTIEGLSEDGSHPLQEAWKGVDVPQCGYCQAGQIMTAAAFLERNPDPSPDQIREAMNGNLCRCASYQRIQEAVELAAKNNKS